MSSKQFVLTARQQQVLQCVKDAKSEGKRPYTRGVWSRMKAKGFDVTERQCSYDLSVIVRAPGTNVVSVRYNSGRTIWIYEG